MLLPMLTGTRRAAPLAVVLALLLSGCTPAGDPSPGSSSNSSASSSGADNAPDTVVLNPPLAIRLDEARALVGILGAGIRDVLG